VAGYVYIAVSKRGFCKVGTAANPRARSYEFARKYDAKICFLVEASDRRSLEGLIYRISSFKSKGQARECMTKILAKLGISVSMIQ